MAVKVKQRKGRWWVVIHHHKQRKSKCVGDKRTAERVAEAIRARLALGQDAAVLTPRQSRPFDAYYQRWVDTYARAHCKESTCVEYDSAYRVHLRPRFGSRDIADIPRDDVKGLVYDLFAKGRKRATVKAVIAPLREMYNHAIEDGHVSSNPAAGIFKRTRLEAGEKRAAEFLTREEVATLLDVCRREVPESYALVLMLARTGMRIGEAVALQWDDVDWRGRFAEIRRSYSKRRLSTPKSGKGRRIDLSRHLVDALAARLVEAKKYVLRTGTPLAPWIFPGENGSPMDANNFRRRQWARLFKYAQMQLVHPHVLRHTYASLLIAQGESLAYVRDQLGHHSIQITVDTYGHLVPSGNRSAVDRLDEPAHADATPAQPAALAVEGESR